MSSGAPAADATRRRGAPSVRAGCGAAGGAVECTTAALCTPRLLPQKGRPVVRSLTAKGTLALAKLAPGTEVKD